MRRLLGLAILCLLPARAAIAEGKGALTVGQLRWDARERPLGFIQFEPRLSWVVSSSRRGQKQTAYQILVASEPAKLAPGKADLWDSQKVVSSESINVLYKGPAPSARQLAFWTVRVWDRDDQPSAFAAPAWWEMGLYDEEWEGQWIGRPTDKGEPEGSYDRSVAYLRKAFPLPANVQRARLYASALGLYEISINGKRAGDNVLAPGFTDFEKRVLFQTYDVTSLLRKGDNVIGAVVAGGWCTAGLGGRPGACGHEPPRVMVQLEVTLADGSSRMIVSDQTWNSQPGPIVSAHLHDGETYDARLEMPGWDTPGYRAHDWRPVQQYDKEVERDLVADPGPPIKVTQDLKPVRLTEPAKGVYVFDLGQNIVGWARVKARAPAGSPVTLRYAEALNPDGTVQVDNLRGAKATDRYVSRGQGTEVWEPRFSIHGFRYVEVRGLTARPGLAAITGRIVHSEMPQAGTLETSSPLVNRLFANILWSQRSAFLSVPTTGSQRDERPGSLLEGRVFALTGCLNNDVQTFYRKWIDDIRDAQLPDAAYSDTAPLMSGREGGPAGSAGVLVPWALYRCYADRTALDAHLASMGRYLELVRTANPDFLWTRRLGTGPGDPQEIGPATDKTLIATAELVGMAEALAQIMRHGGQNLEPHARPYTELAQRARAAFAKTFVLPDGRLKSDTQTAYALAIATGVLAGDARERAGKHLAAAVERQNKQFTTGVLGTAHLLPALSMIGRDDLAYDLLLQRTSSSNHYAYGAVGEWMYDAIGGIALDPGAPAGQHVFVRPRPGGRLTHARARYESRYGPISTDWRRDARGFRLKVTIPANSRATVAIPFPGKVTEGAAPLERAPGVKVLQATGGQTVVAIESGSYDFAVAPP